jgi:hypothetical protein
MSRFRGQGASERSKHVGTIIVLLAQPLPSRVTGSYPLPVLLLLTNQLKRSLTFAKVAVHVPSVLFILLSQQASAYSNLRPSLGVVNSALVHVTEISSKNSATRLQPIVCAGNMRSLVPAPT